MATDFLKKKWEVIFKASDVNKDNVISIEDANMFTELFAAHHKLEKTRIPKLRTTFQKIWRALLLYGRDKIDSHDFVKEMTAAFVKDKDNFRERMQDIQQNLVDVFDVNNDGKISLNEFVVVLKCWGLEDMGHEVVEKFPQSPKGFITKDVWRDAWVYFFCNSDPANVKEERPLVESLGLL